MATYCVICREPLVSVTHIPRTMRFYLSAASADRALVAAAEENPECRVLGIEPSDRIAAGHDGVHAA
jgi:hypothetical protein